jgi:hypothetical protein
MASLSRQEAIAMVGRSGTLTQAQSTRVSNYLVDRGVAVMVTTAPDVGWSVIPLTAGWRELLPVQ